MEPNTIRVFEEWADVYDAWFELHRYAYASELLALQELVPPRGRGLEIGVGSGRFAGPLGVRIGVEPARALAHQARDRGLKVLQGVAEALPFQDQAFDFVLLVTVLCFLSDPRGALREAARVLKPAGRLIIALLDPESPLGRSYELNREKSRFYAAARFQPPGRVLKWLGSLGFDNLQTRQTIFQDPERLTAPEPVADGHGAGVFAVIAGRKNP